MRTGRDKGGASGSVMVPGLLLLAFLSILGVVLLTAASTQSTIASNEVWAEGAFQAAEAGIHVGLEQLTADQAAASRPIASTPIGGVYAFRSGRRGDPGPQPLSFAGTRREPGYSLALGTGYNQAGYVFDAYQIPVTGVGPRNAEREIEVLATYGPTAE